MLFCLNCIYFFALLVLCMCARVFRPVRVVSAFLVLIIIGSDFKVSVFCSFEETWRCQHVVHIITTDCTSCFFKLIYHLPSIFNLGLLRYWHCLETRTQWGKKCSSSCLLLTVKIGLSFLFSFFSSSFFLSFTCFVVVVANCKKKRKKGETLCRA